MENVSEEMLDAVEEHDKADMERQTVWKQFTSRFPRTADTIESAAWALAGVLLGLALKQLF